MVWVFAAVAAVVVFVLAAVVIGRETGRLAAVPPRPVFDLPEAVAWVADRLPDHVSARLSYDDVAALLGFGVDHLAGTGDDQIVVADAETAAYVLGRAQAAGLDVTASDVEAVLDLEVAYLEVIGAANPEADL